MYTDILCTDDQINPRVEGHAVCLGIALAASEVPEGLVGMPGFERRRYVRGVVHSPDGRRIAFASADGTVRVWDVAGGCEVRTLHCHTGPVISVAYSPDGRTLASAGEDQSLRLWDARALTPELRVLCEARGVVEFLVAKSLPTVEVLAGIRRDPTLTDEVRQRALELATQDGR
jgi:hypothetical protein